LRVNRYNNIIEFKLHLNAGGKMENKIKLRLTGNYPIDDLRNAVVTGLTYEYLADRLVQVVKNSKEDLGDIAERLSMNINDSKNVSFANLTEWKNFKMSEFEKLFVIANELTIKFMETESSQLDVLKKSLHEDLNAFIQNLLFLHIDFDVIGFSNIKPEFVKKVASQIAVIDRTYSMFELISSDVESLPVDVQKFANSVLENKINKLDKMVNALTSKLDNNFVAVNDYLLSAFKKFSSIVYGNALDGEKELKARNVAKNISTYRKTLDKIQDKLTVANELRRQLNISKNKINNEITATLENYDRRIEEVGEDRDILEKEKVDYQFVMNSYIVSIDDIETKVLKLNDDITTQFEMLDKVQGIIHSAIPSESELKRYSSISFKFQELAIKLKMTKSQLVDKPKEITEAFNTAINGFEHLTNVVNQARELFMRNTLMSAIFNSINTIYDLVDDENKAMEIGDIKFVTEQIVTYTENNKQFANQTVDFRKMGNDAIRTFAIIMGRDVSGKNIMEIIDELGIVIDKLNNQLEIMKVNNKEQVMLVQSVLKV